MDYQWDTIIGGESCRQLMLWSAVTKYTRIWKTQVSSVLPGIEPSSEHYPSWPTANVFVCAECEYYEALSIQSHSTESFIQKNKTTTPKRKLHQLTQIYRPRRTSYKTRKICLRNVEYQNDAVTSWVRRSLFPKCHMISRCTSKDNFTVAREVRPSLFRCSRNSQMLGTTACRSVMPNFNKSDNEHWT